jgi:hypothetical protein
VNSYRFRLTPNETFINIPINLTFDNEGREDGIQTYQKDVVERAINPISDFEVTRFANALWKAGKTEINYEFYFFDYQIPIDQTTNNNNWIIDYEAASFTDNEIYYFANSFKGSFFKLDFYDSATTENQQVRFSIILPTQQGLKEPGLIGPPVNQTPVEVKKPKFKLDYVGADKEGFFIYWLKDQSYLDTTKFYVSAKFFNAKKGQFVRMMNRPQGVLGDKFNFNKTNYFYYTCILDYETYEYRMFSEDLNGNLTRVGTLLNPIKWYEYVNP